MFLGLQNHIRARRRSASAPLPWSGQTDAPSVPARSRTHRASSEAGETARNTGIRKYHPYPASDPPASAWFPDSPDHTRILSSCRNPVLYLLSITYLISSILLCTWAFSDSTISATIFSWFSFSINASRMLSEIFASFTLLSRFASPTSFRIHTAIFLSLTNSTSLFSDPSSLLVNAFQIITPAPPNSTAQLRIGTQQSATIRITIIRLQIWEITRFILVFVAGLMTI